MKPDLNIHVCPGTLAEGFTTYSLKCRKEMFNGKKVNHILSLSSPQKENDQQKLFIENKTRISISGVQEKYSLKLAGKVLELTDKHGEYILKPIPSDLLNISQVPANEHLTMQIAGQVFKLPVAKNALIFFNDGLPAYITKRFDVKENGSRCLKEDFASLAQLSNKQDGKNYKYDYSYEAMALLIDQYFPAALAVKEVFFQLIVFNYLFSNGDAHLKNFSRIDCSASGDAFLSPAYDLLNTRLHVDDSDLALKEGLYENDFKHPSYSTYGSYAFDDFLDFGKRIGLNPIRIKRMITRFLADEEKVKSLVKRSFLNEEMKGIYMKTYDDKRKRLSTSFTGLL
jgi:serine/threonine-protein kinase HipA